MDWLPRDIAIRERAFARVIQLQRSHGNAIPWAALAEGFDMDGEVMPLSSKAEGIYKPAQHPAALSVKTTMPRPGRSNRYADELASNDGLIRYSYKDRGGPDNPWNASLRLALQMKLPLIYFWALTPGVYAAIVPVFVVADDRMNETFGLAPGDVLESHETPTHVHAVMRSIPERQYVARLVRQRLHQRAFRELVLEAYDRSCAMCTIHFDEFLEAAHILPDRDVRGRPEVPNGMALCALHHEAFDRALIDVTSDYRIQLGPTLRARRNGPVFEAAFLARDGQRLSLPSQAFNRPSLAYLDARRELTPLV